MQAGEMDWKAAAAARGLGVELLSEHTGVRLTGADLAAPDAELIEIMKGAAADRVLVVLPDQGHMQPGAYVDLAGRFDGVFNLHSRRDLCLAAHHEIFLVGNVDGGSPKVGLNWHTDDYHLAKPGLYTFLHAIEIPPVEAGGGTTYVNCIAAYEALAPDLRRRIDGMAVRHSRRRLFRELFPDATEDQVQAEGEKFPDVLHPLVRRHPVNGRRALFLGGEWGSEIDGLDPAESAALYGELLQHLIGGAFSHVHQWTPGDVLFSDNRCGMHRASEWDTDSHRRLLHRIILWDKAMPEGSRIAA